MRRISATLLLLGLALQGCTPEKPVVIAEQAAETKTLLESDAFVPPPRSISDLITKLDGELRARRPVAAAREQANNDGAQSLLPSSGDEPLAQSQTTVPDAAQTTPGSAAQMARAQAARASAAFAAGRNQEGLEARRAAADAARLARLPDLANFLDRLASAENDFGDADAAVVTYAEASRVAEASRNDRGVPDRLALAQGQAALVARIQAKRGRVAEADAALVRMRQIGRSIAFNNFDNDRAGRLAAAEAEILGARGKHADAEAKWREAIGLMEAMEARRKSGNVIVNSPIFYVNFANTYRGSLANNLLSQFRYAEAEAVARQALAESIDAKGLYDVSTIFRGGDLARILLEQGRQSEVEALAARLIEIGTRMQIAPGQLVGSRTLQATALFYQGLYADAVAAYDRLAGDLAGLPNERDAGLMSNRNYGTALAMVGRSREALAVFERNMSRLEQQGATNSYNAQVTRALRGVVHAKAGNRSEALADFRAAGAAMERGPGGEAASAEGASGAAQHLRGLAISGMLEFYASLPADAAPNFVPAAEAFRLADVVRSLSVQGAIDAMNARAGVRDPALADMVRREQDAAQASVAFQGILTNLVSQSAAQRNRNAEEAVRKRVAELDAERAKLNADIRAAFPKYDELRRPLSPSVANARQHLAPNEALLSFFVTDDATYVWALRGTGALGFHKAPIGRAEMATTVAKLRGALDTNAETLDEIPAFDVAAAHRLYAALIEPLAATIGNADTLVVAPHGPLAQLPLALLVTKPGSVPRQASGEAMFAGYKSVPWLVRQAAIVQVPSVSAFQTLRAIPAAAPGRKAFVGFGDPWFSPEQAAEGRLENAAALQTASRQSTSLETRGAKLVRRSAPVASGVSSAEMAQLARLPDTADEIRAVAGALRAGSADFFLGEAANERRVRSMNLTDRRVVMFATHGLVPGDLNGLLQPAIAMSAPSVAGAENGDGLLTMDDVLSLRLNADWVVLSACNTASSNGAGAEAVSGLGRAFFYAGARALLVSNWPVETTSARQLTSDLFARQAADPALKRGLALQLTMLALIDGPGAIDPSTGRTAFNYSHPIFWAPFSLVGDGG